MEALQICSADGAGSSAAAQVSKPRAQGLVGATLRWAASHQYQAPVTLKLEKTTFCPAETVRPTVPSLVKVLSSACPTNMPLMKKFMWVPLKYTVRRLCSPFFLRICE